MKISSKARYAIQTMLQLALREGGRPVTLAELTEQQGISSSYLEQLLASLRDQNLVVGVRGPGGGYKLAQPMAAITIDMILVAVHESHLKRPPASGYDVSIYNEMWWDLSEQILAFLGNISMQNLLDNPNIQSQLHQQRLIQNNSVASYNTSSNLKTA